MPETYQAETSSGPIPLAPDRAAAMLALLRLSGMAPSEDKPFGRCGYRLFEADSDLDICLEIDQTFCLDDSAQDDEREFDLRLSQMVHQSDVCATPDMMAYYKTNAYKRQLAAHVDWCRRLLDTGFGNDLLRRYRAKENECHEAGFNCKYMVIIVGALMMRAGAKMSADDLKHLRELVSQVNCSDGKCTTKDDWGFRAPGRAQFLAALDKYKAGVPRSFQEPSCFTCGKIESDINRSLLKCAKCEVAWYCNLDCQKAHWSTHKETCVEPDERRTMNV